MPKPPPRHLRVVEAPPRPITHSPETFEAHPSERTLFATNDPNILIFIDFPSIDEAEFLSLLISSKPKRILDLRVVPRFDIGSLNRKLVFGVFRNTGSIYHDLGAIIGPSQMRQAAGRPRVLAKTVREQIFRTDREVEGPIAVLVDTRDAIPSFIDEFTAEIDDISRAGWQTLRVPAVSGSAATARRSILFISHATPDDNPFAQWLSTQLTLSGYEVWTDFERLGGGELFWDTIEDIIRNRAVKVIVAASQLAQTRNGVLDEIALAVSVERSLGLNNFVIPLRIDNTPFFEFRANIARKNIIDFQGNWATGLTALLRVLETDRVPAEAVDSVANVGRLIHERLRSKKALLNTPDPVSVNWVQVKSWPSAVHAVTLSIAAGKLSALARTSSIPHVQFGDSLISFASSTSFAAGLNGVRANPAGSIATSEFIKGRWSQFPAMRAHIAQRMLSNLIRQSWERTARTKGLSPFTLSSKAHAWFLANNRIEGNKVFFLDGEGKRRSKTLVGYSQKRGVFWHFAAELKPLVNHPDTLVLKPHVIFSEDGITPLESAARMHALRRGFCKSWWNDRWRDLITAFLSFLSEGSDEFRLDTGGAEIIVAGSMSQFECLVSPDENDDDVVCDELPADEEEDPEIDEDELGFALQVGTPGERP